MPRIYLDRDDRIIFYNNPAGYVNGTDAVIDPVFRTDEMTAFLEKRQMNPSWQDGVYERLAAGVPVEEASAENAPQLKRIRIWQLKPNANIALKFIGYDEVCKQYGEPARENYAAVWDGALDTNDLEMIYERFNVNCPADFTGHSLSISDVVELYDSSGSEFHYCDRTGYAAISFQSQAQAQQQNM